MSSRKMVLVTPLGGQQKRSDAKQRLSHGWGGRSGMTGESSTETHVTAVT